MLPKLSQGVFEWTLWRNGSPADFLVPCRQVALVEIRGRIKRHAVGFCNAGGLLCRPKENNKAVMFFKDGKHFWFHLTNDEFYAIFYQD